MSDSRLFCDKCSIQFKSPEQLYLHEKSAAHFRKLMKNQEQVTPKRETDSKPSIVTVLRSFDDESVSTIGPSEISEAISIVDNEFVSTVGRSGIPEAITVNNESVPTIGHCGISETITDNNESVLNKDQPRNYGAMAVVANEKVEIPSQNFTLNNMSKITTKDIASEVDRGSERKDYVNDTSLGRYNCLICKLELNSSQQADDHVRGKEHLRKAKSSQNTPSNQNPGMVTLGMLSKNADHIQVTTVESQPEVLMCLICNVPLSGPNNAKEHMEGVKHKKKLREKGITESTLENHNRLEFDKDETFLKEAMQNELVSNTTGRSSEVGQEVLEVVEDSRQGLPQGMEHIPTTQSDNSNINDCVHQFEQLHVQDDIPVKYKSSISNNLVANNDKIASVKDKKMNVSELVDKSIQDHRVFPARQDFSASILPSVGNNDQQPVFQLKPTNYSMLIATLNNAPQADSNNAGSPSNLTMNNETGLPITSTKNQNTAESSDSVQEERCIEYSFDGKRGKCFICDIDLTSRQHAKHHLHGERHKKKWMNVKSSASPAQGVSNEAVKNSTIKYISSPATRQQNEGNQAMYHFDGRTGYCTACQIILTSQQHVDQHIDGKPHKLTVGRLQKSEQGVTYSLYCQICEKSFTGQEPALQHYESEKHKRNEQLHSDGTQCLEILPQARKLCTNGTIWFFCDICKSPLNTLEQLEIHQRSPNHLLKLEQMRNTANSSPVISSENSPNHSFIEYQAHNVDTDTQPKIFQPQSGPLSENSQTAYDQLKCLLTYAEDPVINAHPSQKPEHQQLSPSHPQMDYQIAKPHSGAMTTGNGFRNAHMINNHNNVIGGQPNVINETIGTNSANTFCNRNKHSNVQVSDNTNSPGNHSHQRIPIPRGTETHGEMSSQNESTDHMDETNQHRRTGFLHGFEHVKTGVKNSGGRARGGDRGTKRSISLEPATKNEMSSEEEDDNNIVMNIHGEEVQPLAPKLASTKESSAASPAGLNTGSRRNYCGVCDKQMNAKKSYEDHIKGSRHQWKICYTQAPSQSQEPIIKSCTDKIDRVFDLVKTIPRNYQMKLLSQTMSSDCVVYLPTGTGKTLVAILTIALMLEKNPKRPVIFLVDKVLLVIQQARYIKTEFDGKKFRRASLDGNCDEIVERELNLAFICGDLLYSSGMPLSQHDIIVTTVDYCINMLRQGYLCWENFSLAVFDEVHHCVKKHPFKRMIDEHHRTIQDARRQPKVLGLTASPAGKSTAEATYSVLQGLLKSLGRAQLAFVPDNNLELKSYRSIANLHVMHVSMTHRGHYFHAQCIQYFLSCYTKLVPMSPDLQNKTEPPLSYFLPICNDPSEENVNKVTQSLINDSYPLVEILQIIFDSKCSPGMDEHKFMCLQEHIMNILFHIGDIPTGVNFTELKKEFDDPAASDRLQFIKSLDLPCDRLRKQIEIFQEEEGQTEPPMVNRLIQILQDNTFIDWDKKDSLALVLVRERKSARSLSRKLRLKSFVSDKSLQVTALVGHGKGKESGGMRVSKQKEVIDTEYHIRVATSIAEEGVDIQKLALVVCMNPPSNVTAFVQMRGRTRKRDGHFVILCNSKEEERKLSELEQQEKSMMEAAMLCAQEQGQ